MHALLVHNSSVHLPSNLPSKLASNFESNG
jgi:hypothetical protein